MLKIDVIRFEAQDVITTSVANVPTACGCVKNCGVISQVPGASGHAAYCECTDKYGDNHYFPSD